MYVKGFIEFIYLLKFACPTSVILQEENVQMDIKHTEQDVEILPYSIW